MVWNDMCGKFPHYLGVFHTFSTMLNFDKNFYSLDL